MYTLPSPFSLAQDTAPDVTSRCTYQAGLTNILSRLRQDSSKVSQISKIFALGYGH